MSNIKMLLQAATCFLLLSTTAFAVPIEKRENIPCMIRGDRDIPERLQTDIPFLVESVTCDENIMLDHDIPDMISHDVRFSEIDFRVEKVSALGYSLTHFSKLSNDQLKKTADVYRALEIAATSTGNERLLDALKIPLLFMELQFARIGGNNLEIIGIRDKLLKVSTSDHMTIQEREKFERLVYSPLRDEFDFVVQAPHIHHRRRRRLA
ncbi:hypothetical protein V1514DRAFT_344059 [Lipomyces japonicus]|uniref:uncharacterized protein n=1 Tax=Lipomyces japonicus TaxID=56871 RepID=UPI0034CEE133